ncbi:unnamed protein product [Cyclocybe aegerita]|uniref:BBC1/AIM3 cysteine proteinase-fold domain-containing protein n=1 Tax=Cyclocybe aegerita TaxID=1973307 RepID=A0A8S0VR38_CYCAE|nr:unnamed protein product [Cyclocybe aegerita]
MPSFAELKAKAANATSSGMERMQNMRDRNTSVPMAKTNWDPYSGNPPPRPPPPRSLVNRNTKPQAPLPPPPSRTASAATSSLSRASSTASTPPLPARGTPSPGAPPLLPSRSKGPAPPAPPPRSTGPPLPAGAPPPPINRSTRPDALPRPAAPARPLAPAKTQPKIDWANLSPEDKQVFFSWLDEFFANFKPPRTVEAGREKEENHELPSQGPPPIRAASKPTSWSHSQGNQFAPLSHPPATQYGSAGLDLAHYFSPGTVWSGAWYNATDGPTIPPPIVGNKDHTFTCSWRSRGSSKTTHVGVIFSDLSIFWGTVDFTTTNPEDQSQVKRSAIYLPPPKALDRQELLDAHETYGETIALYAESFLGSGQCCARGECWDLANEGLKYFAAYDYIPKTVPSISRTHGHLIFEGRASNGGRQMEGQWRGGDDRVRRGDIAEWRQVRIGMGGVHRGGFYTLGDPDHTAVIVSDAVPSSTPRDGASLSPASLGILTVVEQSLGKPPERREYDLSCFEEGEMWIYRPIGMQTYLGVPDITATPPEGVTGLRAW